ncbi:MAG: hypothetical protein H0X16_03230 [Chloroflexi bacterium]|nr:hypothetical protein [Chloroflexota bacterium]
MPSDSRASRSRVGARRHRTSFPGGHPAATAARIGFMVVRLSLLISLAIGAQAVSAPDASAASPTPEVVAGDTRSEGEGAGLVGQPLLAAAGVILLGLAVVGVTTLYVRLTRED